VWKKRAPDCRKSPIQSHLGDHSVIEATPTLAFTRQNRDSLTTQIPKITLSGIVQRNLLPIVIDACQFGLSVSLSPTSLPGLRPSSHNLGSLGQKTKSTYLFLNITHDEMFKLTAIPMSYHEMC
jgi:hypothetical protein